MTPILKKSPKKHFAKGEKPDKIALAIRKLEIDQLTEFTMAKHPVPKKKTSQGRTSRRYAEFENSTVKRLVNQANLENCPQCGEKKVIHRACRECGTYRGRSIIDRSRMIDKITKIKA